VLTAAPGQSRAVSTRTHLNPCEPRNSEHVAPQVRARGSWSTYPGADLIIAWAYRAEAPGEPGIPSADHYLTSDRYEIKHLILPACMTNTSQNLRFKTGPSFR
jgi:hypothetical protein